MRNAHLDKHTHIIMNVSQNNLNMLKETLAADRKFSRYAEVFLCGNASRLFNIKTRK